MLMAFCKWRRGKEIKAHQVLTMQACSMGCHILQAFVKLQHILGKFRFLLSLYLAYVGWGSEASHGFFDIPVFHFAYICSKCQWSLHAWHSCSLIYFTSPKISRTIMKESDSSLGKVWIVDNTVLHIHLFFFFSQRAVHFVLPFFCEYLVYY